MTAVEDTRTELDQTAVEAFGDRIVGMLGEGMTSLLVSVGHQAGLFDALDAAGPVTSTQLAERAECNERYVREWLGGMTVAEIVVHDPTTDTYRLPGEHAAWLTTAAGPQNLAKTMQFIPMLASVEQEVLHCVRHGGGLSYDRYERFHALMERESRDVFDSALVDVIVPLVPGLDERLRAGIDAADIGCGSGHATNVLAREYPNSRFVGYDFGEEAIEVARAEADAWGLTNARFEVRDVTELNEPDAFDFVTAIDAIHDQAFPAEVLAQISRAVRPDGTFLMVDIAASSNLDDNVGNPMSRVLYALSLFHCMSVSLGLDGVGLGNMWGTQLATSMLNDAGFSQVEITSIEDDPFNGFFICRH